MLVIRRIYLYLVAAIGLAVMVGGIVFLGRTVLAGAVESGFADTVLRRELVVAISLTAAGLVFWGGHWWLITRLTAGSLSERGDALRRLYFYLVLTAMTLLAGLGAGGLIDGVIRRFGSGAHPAIEITDPLPMLLVGAVGWLFHWRLSAADRRDIGEINESAGLRQLYVYGVTAIALTVLLASVVGLLRLASDRIIGVVSVTPINGLAMTVAVSATALAIWLFHWQWSTTGSIAIDDRRSLLRRGYLFFALAVAMITTLFQTSQTLFYGLSRLLGVDRPGGAATDNLVELLADPVTIGAVFGASWIYHRRILRRETEAAPDTAEQIGIHRLYKYLIALVAISLLATGVGGVLWTIGDISIGSSPLAGDRWREQFSLFVTAIIVGLPVWLSVWRPRPAGDEAASLSRRFYAYLALLGGVVASLGALGWVLFEALTLAFGLRSGGLLLTDLFHAASVLVVGATVAAYHGRTIQSDQRSAPAVEPKPPAPAVELEPPAPAADASLTLTSGDGRVLGKLNVPAERIAGFMEEIEKRLRQ